MKKKSLGRDLEDISNVFLSTAKEKNKVKGFSTIAIRDDDCLSCVNMLRGAGNEPKCKIYTFENEQHGVSRLETIALNYANYCEFFIPVLPSKTTDQAPEIKPVFPDQEDDNSEIEERITVDKKVAYPDTKAGQQNIRKTLLRYLEEGYSIRAAELIKSEQFSRTGRKEYRQKEIKIFLKPLEDGDTL